jgi:hypothetical protein
MFIGLFLISSIEKLIVEPRLGIARNAFDFRLPIE